MRVLIVNYYYPPLIDAHAYRWEQIAQYWAKSGHQVEVITGRVHGAPDCRPESGVDVTRVGVIARSVQASPPASNGALQPRRLRARIMDFLRPLYRTLYWPDSAWHWIPSLTLELLRKRGIKYDLVISYYPCMGAHLGVAALKYFSKYPAFKWIADYGDPFSTSLTMQPNNYAVYDRLNKRTERSLARSANFMVFTNEATADAYRTALGVDENVRVIPHLVNIDRLYSAGFRSGSDVSAPVILYYIGGFHKNIREPARLFDLVRGMNKGGSGKYLLKIYGPLNGFNLAELSPADCPEIMYLGPIERDKAIEILKTADAIVNVDNENCIMTPSKIVECISTGRPIVNITNKGTIYPPLEIYEKSGYSLSLVEEKISDDNVIAAKNFLSTRSHSESAPLMVVRGALNSHALETVASQYIELDSRKK